VQGAQNAMRNADNALEKLEGFISKMEDLNVIVTLLWVDYSVLSKMYSPTRYHCFLTY
jgi:hypothetical protein